jgi:hypothetical protein
MPFLIANRVNHVIAQCPLCKQASADAPTKQGDSDFEAGFAVGLEKLVVWTYRSDQFTSGADRLTGSSPLPAFRGSSGGRFTCGSDLEGLSHV